MTMTYQVLPSEQINALNEQVRQAMAEGGADAPLVPICERIAAEAGLVILEKTSDTYMLCDAEGRLVNLWIDPPASGDYGFDDQVTWWTERPQGEGAHAKVDQAYEKWLAARQAADDAEVRLNVATLSREDAGWKEWIAVEAAEKVAHRHYRRLHEWWLKRGME